MKEPLTFKEREFYYNLKQFILENKYTPTIREMGDITFLNSPATVKYYFDKLEKKGYIKRINRRKIIILDGKEWWLINRVVLIGNISTNIELRETKEGKAVATFNLAVSRIGEGTDFLPIVVWGKQADNLKKYCDKGSKISVEGRVQTRDYTDKSNKKHYITEIIGEQVEYLSTNKKSVETPKEKELNPYEEMAIKTQSDLGEQLKITEEDYPF